MTVSGVFFSYSSQKDIDFLASSLGGTDLDEIILAVGGEISLPDSREDHARLTFLLEAPRLGKTESYNRAISMTHGDIAFVVSGDVRFDGSVFNRLLDVFMPEYGMVIPRVVHDRPRRISELIAGVMWDIHDTFMDYMASISAFFCGGEFQAVRNPRPIERSDAVNDDEFLCHQVYSSGRRIGYARSVTVKNAMPGSLRDLMIQRIRVNYGHIQFKQEKKLSGSISQLGIRDAASIARIMLLQSRRYWRDTFVLPLAALFELVSMAVARRAFHRGASFARWELAKGTPGKGGKDE